jgi:predicted ATPase
MITRLYADNFKTLVNFELPLAPMNLLLGANGSGKSNVLEVIRLIRRFVCEGESSDALFPTSTFCRWERHGVQTFAIDLRDREGTVNYAYKLEIGRVPELRRGDERDRSVASEQLFCERRPVYVSQAGSGELQRANGALRVRFARNHSGVGVIEDDAVLSDFKRRLEMVWPLRTSPDKMLPESQGESICPNDDLSNFAAWYRHLALDRFTTVFDSAEFLGKEVLDGFRSLRLKSAGERSRELWAEFAVHANENAPEKSAEFRFDELSDGQRVLIALYTLAFAAGDETTLCLDHPENHLALPEIQPWLLRLADATEEGRCQAIIATHHPDIINLLAAHSGYWLERPSGGPTRVRKIGEQDPSGLPLSELIARGWLHG